MTLEEYNNNLRDLAQEIGARFTERVLMVGAVRMLSSMQNRIFRDGQDSNGGKIGSYSTTPIYVTKDQFVKKSAFKPAGKRGFNGERLKAVKKPKGQRRTKGEAKQYSVVKKKLNSMYLPGGYKEFREIQGRPTNEVNFFMKGDLRQAYTLQAKEKEILIGFNNERESDKRKGLEVRFKGKTGTIFPATTAEKELYSKEVINELKTVNEEIIKGL